MGMMSMMSILATPDTDAIRREDFKGVEHLVVPVIMLQEQVLWPANAESPELALAEEFGRFPESWNGRPVVLNHPKRNGMAISANAPDILTERAFGQVFNSRMDETGKKLKGELWINTEVAEELGSEFTAQVDRLESGEEVVEVSTGLFMMAEQVQGVYNGEEFSAIWRDVVPDHLAILPEGITGACSVEDGCGAPRLNESAMRALEASGKRVQAIVLTPNSDSNKGEGTMACTCGAKDPTKCECGSARANEDHKEGGMFHAMMQKFGHLFSFRNFRGQSTGLSDRDRRRALDAALQEEGGEDFFWIVAVFDGTFVYEQGFSDTLIERGFEISESGVISLAEEKVKVRPVTSFVPVETPQSMAINQEGGNMLIDVDAVIASGANGFTEDDREFLTGLSEDQLSKMVVEVESGTEASESSVPTEGTVEPAPAPAPASEPTNEGIQPSHTEEPAVAANQAKPKTAAEYISQAPAEIQEVLSQGLRMQQARRDELVKGIAANSRNLYTESELKELPLAQLEKIAALAMSPSYEGAGAVRTQEGSSAHEDDMYAPPMPTLFPAKAE